MKLVQTPDGVGCTVRSLTTHEGRAIKDNTPRDHSERRLVKLMAEIRLTIILVTFWIPASVSREIKLPEREAGNSSVFSAEVRSGCYRNGEEDSLVVFRCALCCRMGRIRVVRYL